MNNEDALPIRVRTTCADDAPQLRELRLEALRNHPIAFTADLAESEAFPPEHWRERAAAGAGEGREAVFVAERDERLLGMTGIYVVANRPKLAHTAVIWGVYVRREARGCGVGKMLVNAALDWARAKRLKIVKLSATVAEDPAPRRCYERCGFVPYGVDPMAVQVDGKFYDEVLMSCQL